MKTVKKLLAVLLAGILAFTFVPAFAADETDLPAQTEASDPTVLRFREDGTFKIMLIADPQDDENLEETTTAIMNEALDQYAPDLVIYLGDNTVADGYENQKTAIEAVTKPVVDRGIPFAIVFGNHDEEHDVSKEELLEIYRSLGCLTYDAVPEMHGCGTCNLPILASDSDKAVFNLWLTDSGDYNRDEGASGYDYVHEDTIAWYKETAAALAEENGGKPVPAMNFQHIVIPEIYDELYVKFPFSLGALSQERYGNYYSLLPVFTRLNGYWLEVPCPPDVYDGQLDAWVETGDVIAAFHGHDHNNSYEVNISGVDVINVPSVGCNSYSKPIDRGVGLVTLYENDPAAYDYELIRMYDLALEKDSMIPQVEGGRSAAYYAFFKVLDAIVMAMFRVFRAFYTVIDAVKG